MPQSVKIIIEYTLKMWNITSTILIIINGTFCNTHALSSHCFKQGEQTLRQLAFKTRKQNFPITLKIGEGHKTEQVKPNQGY